MNGLALRALSLCSGIGGMELGLKQMGVRTVCYVERDSFAAAVLVARMASKALDQAPVWDDLTTFYGRRWRGVVDIVTAGFPCQPVSLSGSRAGTDDERWIWPLIERILDDVRPRYVFLENVPGLLSLGVDRVLGSLASLGFDAEWTCLPASSVGASYERNRWFCLGVVNTSGTGLEGSRRLQGHTDDGCGEVAFAPGPNDDRWTQILERRPDLEPSICRVAHGISYHVDRLRCLGNAVVPDQAAAAFAILMSRIDPDKIMV